MAVRNSFKTGSSEMLILHILSEYGDCYAYQISQLIIRLSEGQLSFPEGSLYPSFYKMMDNKYISNYKQQIGTRMVRIYYRIEPAGRLRLSELYDEYRNTIASINKILDYDFSTVTKEDLGGE